MSDMLADTEYAKEYYLRHLLKEDRLPGFQGQKKKKKDRDVVNYSEMIKGYVFYTLPKRQIRQSINLVGIFAERVMTSAATAVS